MSQGRFNATIEIRAGESTDSIYSAMKPDVKSSPKGQVSMNIMLKDDVICMSMYSDDLSHIRASLNSYLRLASAAFRSLDVTRHR